MKPQRNSTRLIINTGAQYTRTVINVFLSLYSTRLILNALGVDDYGIFMLIGGVVSMLSFVTNAMISATQRFLSYNQGVGDSDTQKKVFSNSIFIHLFFSIGIFIILEIAGLFLFDGFLNIVPDRIHAAKIIYQISIAMVILSFMTAPYKALLISHENLVYISVIDVCDGLLKFAVALILTFWGYDKLITYGFLMTSITIFNFVAFFTYSFRRYEECIMPKTSYLNESYLKSISSFIGWQLYNTGCVVGRTQGTALILNKFFGTVVNAAFGIALQVSGAVNFISTSLTTAINPQIVKAEGQKDRKKMLSLAQVSSKFSFLLLSILVVPICFRIHDILKFWLGEIPDWSALFCRVILITALIDQITAGLIAANQAIGNLRAYSLTVNTIKILTIPIFLILLLYHVPLKIAIWCYAVIELICAICRLPFLKLTGGLVINEYIHNVFYRIFFPFAFLLIAYFVASSLTENLMVFILEAIIITIVYLAIIYYCGLNVQEKKIIVGIKNSLMLKFKI